ncbi:MAG: aldehyde dehydrogenase family protein [Firmicutes bacterium]|nr:aldehyde dehydrogenase family protein [Bacillota bacterium]
MEDRNPADVGDVVALFPAMQRSDVENAVNAAARAFPAWRAADWVKRGEFLKRTAQLLRERAESIARDLAREMGKTLREARTEVVKAADFFEYYGSLGRLPVGNLLPDARAGVTTISTREPLGVVVAITPWNDPLLTPARKLAPALVAGNTVILKPSSLTPLSAWHLIKALHDAGVSDGVANLVTGSGSSLVETLVGHPEVRAVTFTGSTEVGLQLQKMAAGRNIRVQTEMGGKNALVVLRDANLDLAADLAVTGAFAQAGQRCTATSRIIVEDAVHDPFLEKMAERTKAMRIGPGLDERTDMGPVVDQGQLDTVLEFVEGACREGASLAVGGRRLTGEPYDRGYFVEPTIFTDVQPSMTIAQKEVFGPVVAVMRVGSFDEAVEVVNGTRYGLSASVVTRSLESAHRFAAEVDVGCVGVNVPTAGWDVHISFGGFKDSGSAFREQGLEALQFYTRVKSVAMQVMGI